MQSYTQSVMPMIETSYDKLTNVEKSIADFFLNNVDETDFSSKNISQKLYVSEASLSRFAKKIGFSGYREFIFAYLKDDQPQKNLDLLTKQVLNSYQKVIDKTYSLVDNEQMIRIAKMLDEYDRVFIYGIGSSAVVAREFKLRFMRLGLDVDYLADEHSIKMNITRVKKNTLVIGISISGRTTEILEGLEEARRRGAKTIMMSASDINEYRKKYDELILVGGLKNLAISDKIPAQVPILIVIDMATVKLFISKTVNKKTFNDNISKITRN